MRCGLSAENPEHIRETCSLVQRRTARDDIVAMYGDLRLALRRNNTGDDEQVRKAKRFANRKDEIIQQLGLR